MARKITGTKKRNYVPSYLSFGFISQTKGDSILPLCLCNKTFTNALMKPSTLKRHLETSHFELKDKPVEFFERKCGSLATQKKILLKEVNISKKAKKASYLVGLLIAKAKKTHHSRVAYFTLCC